MTKKNSNSLNEELKRREEFLQKKAAETTREDDTMALDDTQRVKVLSPGRLVTKRFFRNKLALVGLAILIFMFIFAFIGPLFYPYSQTQIFYKYDNLNIDYASATQRTENISYLVADGAEVSSRVKNSINSYISDMEEQGKSETIVTDQDGTQYVIDKLGENVYTLSADNLEEVAVYSEATVVADYNKIKKSFSWKITSISDELFETAVADAIAAQKSGFVYSDAKYTLLSLAKNEYRITRETPETVWSGENLGDDLINLALSHLDGSGFSYNGVSYRVRENTDSSYLVCRIGERTTALVASPYEFSTLDISAELTDDFKAGALLSLYDSGKFSVEGKAYSIEKTEDGYTVTDATGTQIASLGTFVVRRYSGQDTLPLDFKEKAQQVVQDMVKKEENTSSFTYSLPEMDMDGNYITDENGDLVYVDTEIEVTRKSSQYVLTCEQVTYLIDIYASPSRQHVFGTDGDGMDILARMMYGGRISLMVGFVVVLLELVLGVILGGLAGFFGKWVDTLIMRLVDVFYCIPSLPILIIMGAFFDAIKMNPYERLVWLMAILGILGWAGVARLVRGQILSLREQEFMIAQEATGIKAMRRIFRHLIPNVMPQLIVNATMGLGSVIILESTLSFLGLGVKHPLATWGTMINSVTKSTESMIKYTYIWIPVGLLICLTVVAFNFIGDGLRDAFDPKMKQ